MTHMIVDGNYRAYCIPVCVVPNFGSTYWRGTDDLAIHFWLLFCNCRGLTFVNKYRGSVVYSK